MKRITLVLLIALTGFTAKAQYKIGQQAGDIQFDNILNGPIRSTSLGKLRGKIVLLDFWATWCGPCITAMNDLKSLQNTYPDKLQVIAINIEDEQRVKRFLRNQTSNLWFTVDDKEMIRKHFPFQIIPHSVLIDQAGKIVAITDPENITTQVIRSLIANKQISLPVKQDGSITNMLTTYFSADTSTQSRFLIQPKQNGLGSATVSYDDNESFKDRRITMVNVSVKLMYRMLYNNFPSKRILDFTGKTMDNKLMYCIDLIVPKGQEKQLFPILRRKLDSLFVMHANLERRTQKVYVLAVANRHKLTQQKSTLSNESIISGRGTFSGQGISLERISQYIEHADILGVPIIDETGDRDKYDITLNYQPGKKDDLLLSLSNVGLTLTRTERELDMLVLSGAN